MNKQFYPTGTRGELTKKYQPIELDALGNPCWITPVSRRPWFSAQAYPLPFWHPKLKVARPASWSEAGALSFITYCTFVVPLEQLAKFALCRLNRGRLFPATVGISLVLQRITFWAASRYRAWDWNWDWEYDSIKAPIVFPGEVTAMPVDAGLVEPVLALYALGVQICNCYDGYGVTLAGIRLKAGFEFPQSLLDALNEAGTHYFQICGDKGIRRELVANCADSDFTVVLRRWARRVRVDRHRSSE